LPEGRAKLALLPGAVRKYEIQEPTLLAGSLLREQRRRPPGEFEKLDALLHVALVRGLVLLDGPQDAILLGSPLRSLLVEERRIDPAVELVEYMVSMRSCRRPYSA
jgi:hypothetical protein